MCFLVAIAAAPLASGFRSTTSAPFAMPSGPDGPKVAPEEDWAAVFKAKKKLKKPRYDLGIGKNQPVLSSSMATMPGDAADAADENVGQFINDYESVRTFPAPPSPFPTQKPQKKVLPKVQPRRNAQDILDIHFSRDSDSVVSERHPVISPVLGKDAEPIKLDPNTIWVEMMLHDEMNKLVVN